VQAPSESDSAAALPDEPPVRGKGRTPLAALNGQSAPQTGAATRRPPRNPTPSNPPPANQAQGKGRKGAKAAGKENCDGKG
jgi:hypothetical protein